MMIDSAKMVCGLCGSPHARLTDTYFSCPVAKQIVADFELNKPTIEILSEPCESCGA